MDELMAEAKKSEENKKTEPVFKLMKSGFRQVGGWLNSHATEVNAVSAVIVAGATTVLVILTCFYLKETKSQRLAAQRSIELTEKEFEFEASPKPYIKDVETEWRVSESRESKVLGTIAIKLANCGRSEATNVRLHTILTKGSLTDEQTIKLLQYVYPGQQPLYSMRTLKIDCTPEEILALKEGKALQIPKEKQEPISLKIELIYDDTKGECQTVPYQFDYNYRLNKWVPAGFGFE